MRIDSVDLTDDAVIAVIARRMRRTLQEVVGETRGAAMYDLPWLEDRLRQHLDGRYDGAVFVARIGDGATLEADLRGHTVVRAEQYDGRPIGLFSTTWVEPDARRQGFARRLLDRGEAWFVDRGLGEVHTCTAADNNPLRALYAARGYVVVDHTDEMVRLARHIDPADPWLNRPRPTP